MRETIEINSQKENYTLYFFKAAACLFIIVIHTGFPLFGGGLTHIARFAVPFFFMVTGYYIDLQPDKIKRRIDKSAVLLMTGVALYLALNLIILIKEGGVGQWLQNLLLLETLFKVLVLNWSTPLLGVGPMWYLAALFYALCVICVLLKMFGKKRLFCILGVWSCASILYIVVIHILCFSGVAEIRSIYWRNFLTWALPCIFIGMNIRKYEDKIKLRWRIADYVWAAGMILTAALILAEGVILGNAFEVYPSSLLLSAGMLIFAIKNPELKLLVHLGRDLSHNVYLLHNAVMEGLLEFTPKFLSGNIRPFTFFVVTIVTLAICEWIYRIKLKRRLAWK